MKRIEVRAQGIVQGVGFRFFVDDCAAQAGVSGFVRNMPDGSVWIVAEGSGNALDHFLFMVQAQSRSRIRIDSLDVRWCRSTGEYHGFQIRA